MIPFVGSTRKKDWVSELHRRQVGRIFQRYEIRDNSPLYPGERWAFDNGAYSDWTNCREFPAKEFRTSVDRVMKFQHRPFFAVTPDRPGHKDSLEFSYFWIRQLPSTLNWYLAVQDGMSERDVREALDSGWFSGLFIGGTDKFKHTAPEWVDLAHTHGKPCHYGRASTPKKMRAAWRVGCDSFDTSFPLWTKERFWEFLRVTTVDHYEEPSEVFRW